MRRYLNCDHFVELSLTRHTALLSDADTGSGLAVKEAGQNAASLAKSAGAKVRRQGAGVGAACNSLLSDADTGSGLAVKEAGQNAASLLKGAGAKRQLDKVGAGVRNLSLCPALAAPQFQLLARSRLSYLHDTWLLIRSLDCCHHRSRRPECRRLSGRSHQ